MRMVAPEPWEYRASDAERLAAQLAAYLTVRSDWMVFRLASGSVVTERLSAEPSLGASLSQQVPPRAEA